MTSTKDLLVGVYGQIVQVLAEATRLATKLEQLRQDVRNVIDVLPDDDTD